jgi:hypothetical protein
MFEAVDETASEAVSKIALFRGTNEDIVLESLREAIVVGLNVKFCDRLLSIVVGWG